MASVCDGAALDRERRLWDAYRALDVAQLEALIEERALDIGPAGALDRAGVLAAVARMRIDEYTLFEMSVRKLGDVEIVSYRSTVAGSYDGTPFPAADVLVTTVWRRTNGRWRVAHRQETPTRPKSSIQTSTDAGRTKGRGEG